MELDLRNIIFLKNLAYLPQLQDLQYEIQVYHRLLRLQPIDRLNRTLESLQIFDLGHRQNLFYILYELNYEFYLLLNNSMVLLVDLEKNIIFLNIYITIE